MKVKKKIIKLWAIYKVKIIPMADSPVAALGRNYPANNSMSPFRTYEKIDACPCRQVVVVMETLWLEMAELF